VCQAYAVQGSAASTCTACDPTRSSAVSLILPAPIAAAGPGLQRGATDPAARGGDRLGQRRPTARQARPRRCSLGRRLGPASPTPQQRGQQLCGPLGPVPGQTAGDGRENGRWLGRLVAAAAAASPAVSADGIGQRAGSGGGGGAGTVGRCRGQCQRVRSGRTSAGCRRVERPGRRAAASAAGGRLPPAPMVRRVIVFQGPSATAARRGRGGCVTARCGAVAERPSLRQSHRERRHERGRLDGGCRGATACGE